MFAVCRALLDIFCILNNPALFFYYLWSEPDGNGQTPMMNHVKGREVRKLFPQYEEERVEKINKL